MYLNTLYDLLRKNENAYDVFGIGNAIVDLLVFVDDEFVESHQLPKGHMKLSTSEEQAKLLFDLEKFSIHMASGGSAANTMISIANIGGKTFFTGKIAKDPNGEFYRVNLKEAGVEFDVHPIEETEGSTATCIVLITPDAERTMSTHLGVSILLHENDIQEEIIKKSKMVYIEGYLWLNPITKQAALKTIEIAKMHQVPVSFTFSDGFVVAQFREEFEEKIKNHDFDVVFMNADEIQSFFAMEDYQKCLHELSKFDNLFFVTNSEKGANVVYKNTIIPVSGFPVKALDTTGAGDYFAGGTLFGLTRLKTPEQSAKWGNYLASKVVQVQGARLDKIYKDEITKIKV
ncbi:MAG: adenosine kinase [Leptospiraceae bacterium]|nr:adenosine kinase [Leptospiraceae bacterium]MDW7976619.1 adenosine kinase [Leptospiraceae bacterium]